MSWDRELQALEAAIVRLNAEYDAFLYGSALKPPSETRKNVERIFRRLSDLELESAADRYRFSTIQGRYNSLCERWDRLQTEKEEGRRPGVYGGFARDSRHVAAMPRPSPPAAVGPAPNAAAVPSVQRSGALDRDADLFERYLAARRERGEDVRGYDLKSFKQSLDQQREKLKDRFGASQVDFEVAEREGRVKLVARKRPAEPVGTGGSGKEEK